jgi:hypothetical protein
MKMFDMFIYLIEKLEKMYGKNEKINNDNIEEEEIECKLDFDENDYKNIERIRDLLVIMESHKMKHFKELSSIKECKKINKESFDKMVEYNYDYKRIRDLGDSTVLTIKCLKEKCKFLDNEIHVNKEKIKNFEESIDVSINKISKLVNDILAIEQLKSVNFCNINYIIYKNVIIYENRYIGHEFLDNELKHEIQKGMNIRFLDKNMVLSFKYFNNYRINIAEGYYDGYPIL